MRSQLEAVIKELKQLKAEGAERVYLESSTLHQLREKVAHLTAEQPARSNAANEKNETREQRKPQAVRSSQPSLIQLPESAPVKKKAVEKSSKYVTAPIPEPPVVQLPEGSKSEQWEWLERRVLECPVCNAHVRKDKGKKVVFGVGNIDADIFFCGEGPGAEEEVQGEPFVGPAGQLLTKIINAMGLSREQVYIGNIMNWRPEMPTEYGNRKPYPEEMAFCLPYLNAQIEIVQPKVVVALGATAVDGLLGPDPQRKMGRIRGQWQDFQGVPLMVTYHPSYLLRNNTLMTKRLVWEDMLCVMERLEMPVSEKQRGFFLK